jgi:NAD(P)H-hydrate epimerase
MPVSHLLMKQIYKERPKWSHKGDFGKLLVVGGSTLYSGSPIFNALAAYRAGCDLVKIATAEKTAWSIRSYLPDLVAYPLEGDFITKKNLRTIFEMQKDADAMVIGGGLGRSKPTLRAIRSIIKRTKLPTVVDADAIHAVNFKLRKNFAVTPHSYEFYLLSGKRPDNDVSHRSVLVKELAKKLNCVVLLKGHIDVISDGNRIALNKTGNAFMTKGGFGDTLAGVCGALLARGVDSYDAACAAAYINGRAGDLAAKKFGEGVLASDLVNEIPKALA